MRLCWTSAGLGKACQARYVARLAASSSESANHSLLRRRLQSFSFLIPWAYLSCLRSPTLTYQLDFSGAHLIFFFWMPTSLSIKPHKRGDFAYSSPKWLSLDGATSHSQATNLFVAIKADLTWQLTRGEVLPQTILNASGFVPVFCQSCNLPPHFVHLSQRTELNAIASPCNFIAQARVHRVQKLGK